MQDLKGRFARLYRIQATYQNKKRFPREESSDEDDEDDSGGIAQKSKKEGLISERRLAKWTLKLKTGLRFLTKSGKHY